MTKLEEAIELTSRASSSQFVLSHKLINNLSKACKILSEGLKQRLIDEYGDLTVALQFDEDPLVRALKQADALFGGEKE